MVKKTNKKMSTHTQNVKHSSHPQTGAFRTELKHIPKTMKGKLPSLSLDVKTLNLAPLATLGPIGYFPKGSGTLGALVALPFIYLISCISTPLLWMSAFMLFVLGLIAIEQFTRGKPDKDPSCVIIDEVVGQMIPFMVILPEFMHWPILFLGFALFRFFDIFKFGIVAFWDQRKNPLGVMMDDVTAGLCAGFMMAMLQVIVVEFFGI